MCDPPETPGARLVAPALQYYRGATVQLTGCLARSRRRNHNSIPVIEHGLRDGPDSVQEKRKLIGSDPDAKGGGKIQERDPKEYSQQDDYTYDDVDDEEELSEVALKTDWWPTNLTRQPVLSCSRRAGGSLAWLPEGQLERWEAACAFGKQGERLHRYLWWS
ncbi:unnamed protein product [Protopolystoma xenopodis]|uniref:Uncharacterized protein n=1 Tax=Protopolystoma xenopodis TaxID=117903 RepID=A0A3S5AKJ1_9PLAT|nr:unnamed protein product [Protopolystoma xenopodis]